MWASGAGFNAAATPPFVAAIEGGSPMAVCAAFPPNGGFATDAAVLGKYEQGWGSCNVAGFAGLAPGASSEFNARNFSAWRASGFDARSVLADPQFVDAPGLDFSHLQPTSPAIALGFVPIDTSGVGPRAPWAQRR